MDINGIDDTEEVPIEIDDEESTESSKSSANNVLKKNEIVDPTLTMSSSKSEIEIASTSTEKVPIVSDCEKSTESSNSSNVSAKISIIDPRKMMKIYENRILKQPKSWKGDTFKNLSL